MTRGYLFKKAKVKLAKLQISYCNLAKSLLPTGKKAIVKKRLIVKLCVCPHG